VRFAVLFHLDTPRAIDGLRRRLLLLDLDRQSTCVKLYVSSFMMHGVGWPLQSRVY
jgi:hypothetical protein